MALVLSSHACASRLTKWSARICDGVCFPRGAMEFIFFYGAIGFLCALLLLTWLRGAGSICIQGSIVSLVHCVLQFCRTKCDDRSHLAAILCLSHSQTAKPSYIYFACCKLQFVLPPSLLHGGLLSQCHYGCRARSPKIDRKPQEARCPKTW